MRTFLFFVVVISKSKDHRSESLSRAFEIQFANSLATRAKSFIESKVIA